MLFMPTTTGEELKELRERARMTQGEFAIKLGIEKTRYQNWEYDRVEVPDNFMARAKAIARGDDLSEPTAPAPMLNISIPYIGGIAASTPVDWTDPYESTAWEEVPYEMGDSKGRYSGRVVGLSMYPLLVPDDLLIFQASSAEKLGVIVLHRCPENKVAVKVLRQDGTNFLLESINSAFEVVPATGEVIGFLVGIIRRVGSRVTTEYDPNGIRP